MGFIWELPDFQLFFFSHILMTQFPLPFTVWLSINQVLIRFSLSFSLFHIRSVYFSLCYIYISVYVQYYNLNLLDILWWIFVYNTLYWFCVVDIRRMFTTGFYILKSSDFHFSHPSILLRLQLFFRLERSNYSLRLFFVISFVRPYETSLLLVK